MRTCLDYCKIRAIVLMQEGAAAPFLFREPLIKSTMNRVAIENGMMARRTTQVVVILRSQGVQRSKHSFLMQPCGTGLCRRSAASCFLLREWPLTSKPSLHPIPQSHCRGHVGLN